MFLLSLPMRERGLKFHRLVCSLFVNTVAPHAGAWIEMLRCWHLFDKLYVAPHAGAWIEMLL